MENFIRTVGRMMSILKRCPSCGGKARLMTYDTYGSHYVQCDNVSCGIVTWIHTTEEEAVEAWNKMVTDEEYVEKHVHKKGIWRMSDLISKSDAIDALWKALYEYEDETEKQFQESEDLDVEDWIGHRIFVQNMNDIDRQTILNLPSAQPDHVADIGKKVDVDDCISRRAVKEKLKQNLTYMRAFGVERCMNLIDEIPAVETESKWISCKEKMPEEDLWTGASQQYSYGVLMYVLDYSDGDTMIDFGHTIDGKWYSDTADAYVENSSNWKVIAWMLPPSYKENK